MVNQKEEFLPSFEYFQKFVEEERKRLSFYETLCKKSPKIVKAPKKLKNSLEKAIWLSGLKISADEAFSLAIFSFFFSFPFLLFYLFFYF